MSDSESECFSEASQSGVTCVQIGNESNEPLKPGEDEKSTSEASSNNSGPSAKSGRGPPPPVPSKPPRVYALAKGSRSQTGTPTGNKSCTEEDSSAESYKSVGSSKSIPCNESSKASFQDKETDSVSVNEQLKQSLEKPNTMNLSEEITAAQRTEEHEGRESAIAKEGSDSTCKMKNVEIYISDVDNPELENGEERDEMMIADDNMIPLIINDILPLRSRNNSPNVVSSKKQQGIIGNANLNIIGEDNDETCITGCSWEMDDDDDGTDCSSSCGLDRSHPLNVNTCKCDDGICGAADPLTPTTRRKATVGCSMVAATSSSSAADSQLKDQIVVVKLAAKVVQCPSASPSSTMSASPRPPPPPPPIPSYPDSSTATDSSSYASNSAEKEIAQRIRNSNNMSYYNDDDDPGKDGNEPGVEESSTSELYQNMVVAHGLMIEREMGADNVEVLVQKVVNRQQRVESKNHRRFALPTRPLTEGRGIDDLSEDDEGEDDEHCYQNIIVKKGKFSVATKKSNTKSSCDPSVQNVPFTGHTMNSINFSSEGKGFSTRIMELDQPSSETPVPVVHAVINLPPRKASLIKERRRIRMENLSYQRASRINQLMLAEFKAGNDRPSSVSLMRDGKVMSVTSNNCSDLGNGDGTASEPGSIIGKVKIGFGLNKAKTSLQKSKSVVTSHVEKARRKVGSWYHRRVKTPVDQMGTDVGMSRSSSRQAGEVRADAASIESIAGHEYGGGGMSSVQSRRSSTPAEFLDYEDQQSQAPQEIESENGPAYSNVVYGRKCQSADLESRADDVFDREESDDENSFKTKGQNEFEELRRVVKQGGDFCKDLAAVLQERSELEAQYAKGLSKLSAKLLKASKEATGSVAHAWQAVAVQIDTQAELHRQWSTALAEEVARPLRSSLETQHKIRKSVEVLVEKTTRNLAEWRTAESKAKRQCFSSSKEFEKLQESSAVIVNNNLNNASSTGSNNTNSGANSNSNANSLGGSNLALAEVRTRSRLLSVPPLEKDPIKLEAKRRKAEEAVRRADIEYYTFCVRSERARLEWESAIRNGSTCLRTLEEEKLSLLRDLAIKYYQYLNELAPRQVQSVESLEEPVKNCSVNQDMHAIVDIRRHAGAEQLLPDFYAEDTSNLMKRERRQEALQKFLYLINQDLEREKKGAVGIETLAKAIAEAPKIDNAHHDISDKLYYVKSMLLYLEGTRCKVDNALADIESRQRTNNPITQYMRHQRDKQGFPQTILKVPSWAKDECLAICTGSISAGNSSPDWNDRGNADGTSGQHETDFDEFSSQDSGCDHNTDSCGEESNKAPSNIISAPSIGRCRAIYDYDANLFDELTIRTGDVINIHDKQEDGWWLGELNGIIGIFPATYVEETSPPSETNSVD